MKNYVLYRGIIISKGQLHMYENSLRLVSKLMLIVRVMSPASEISMVVTGNPWNIHTYCNGNEQFVSSSIHVKVVRV